MTYSTNSSTSAKQIPSLDNLFFLKIFSLVGNSSLFSDYWFSFCSPIDIEDKAQGVLVFSPQNAAQHLL